MKEKGAKYFPANLGYLKPPTGNGASDVRKRQPFPWVRLAGATLAWTVIGQGCCAARFTKRASVMRYTQLQAQRTKLLQKARKLARSGQHDNHLTILSELEGSGEFLEVHRCLT